MGSPAVDYDALARQQGGTPAIDYDSLAAQHGGTPANDASSTQQAPPVWRTALNSMALPPQMGGSVGNLVDTAIGAGKGLAHTIYGAAKTVSAPMENIAGRVAEAIKPGSQQKMQQRVQSGDQSVENALAPTSPVQKATYGAEQAAEYIAPSMAAGKVAKNLSAARTLGRIIAQGAAAAAVGTVQSGGDVKAGLKTAAVAAGTEGALSAAGKLAPSAERLYQSALKPSEALTPEERAAIIQTGLKEGVQLDANVVDNVQNRISNINDEIMQGLKQHSAAGATADPNVVAGYTGRSANLARTQVNPEQDIAAVENARQEFLRSQGAKPGQPAGPPQPTGLLDPQGKPIMNAGTPAVPPTPAQPIPLEQAQALKQGTYRKLKSSYGEQSSASREAQKDLARGLKDQIVQAFPEIGALNEKESALLKLEASLERFVGREGNKELIGLGTPMTTLAGHAMGIPAVPAWFLSAALKSSEIKSRIAIAMARAAQYPGAGTAIRNAIPGVAASKVMPPPQPQQRHSVMPPPQ